MCLCCAVHYVVDYLARRALHQPGEVLRVEDVDDGEGNARDLNHAWRKGTRPAGFARSHTRASNEMEPPMVCGPWLW